MTARMVYPIGLSNALAYVLFQTFTPAHGWTSFCFCDIGLVCRPGGHYWDYYTGTLSHIQVTAAHSRTGWQYILSTDFRSLCGINSLWHNDTIWRHGSWSTLAQVMACCLTAPSHYLNQCWLIISNVPCHSSKGIIIQSSQDTNQ